VIATAAPDPRTPDTDALEARVVAAARVADPDVEVIEIDPDLADTAAFCEAYGYTAAESANCLLVAAKTGDAAHAACLVQATRRLDLNRHSRLIVGARKASFAPTEDTTAITGMIPGGVTPIGLPDDLPLFIDAGVMDQDRVIIGGGGRGVKLRIATAALATLPGARVEDISRD
jgi:prolyl-tRNA editing enzyme YbaK/EbsC (Cys-tRNA(Pro) deacylase)